MSFYCMVRLIVIQTSHPCQPCHHYRNLLLCLLSSLVVLFSLLPPVCFFSSSGSYLTQEWSAKKGSVRDFTDRKQFRRIDLGGKVTNNTCLLLSLLLMLVYMNIANILLNPYLMCEFCFCLSLYCHCVCRSQPR